MKAFPTYRLSLEVAGGQISIELPFRCEFNVTRTNLAAANSASFRLFNLKEQTRNLIFQDAYNWTVRRAIQFRVGYSRFQPLVFNGTIKSAQSSRQGVNMVTQIEAMDGAFQMVNGFTSTTQQIGASHADLLRLLSVNLPQIQGEPIIGSFPTVNARGTVLVGNTWNLIQEICGGIGIASIDNNQVKILQLNEAVLPADGADIPLISSQTGLLESPIRGTNNNFIEIVTLFEPRITVGQLVQLQSQTNSLFNGTYKVIGFEHNGLISTTDDAKRTTRASLYRGEGVFGFVKGTPVQ